MNTTTVALNLDRIGDVPATYQHEWRVAEAREPIVVPDGIFKWYHVRREGAAVPEELDAEALALLVADAARGDWSMEYGLNFALLHVSTAHAFLTSGVWRGHQELWTRTYVKDLTTLEPFTLADRTGMDAPFACVWEMAVICHERMAWHRYLFSDRGNADKVAWLSDTYSGPA